MAWYRTGTVTVTNGSATITGSGTAFIANASIGEGFLGPDGRTYEVTNITSDTALTISPAYLGSTASGQAYAIAPLRGRIADLISETSSLLSSFASVRDGAGAGLFPDGSVVTPAIRFSADQDTGIYRSGSGGVAFSSNGVQAFRVNGTGRTQFGTAASGFARVDIVDTLQVMTAIGGNGGQIYLGNGDFQSENFFVSAPGIGGITVPGTAGSPASALGLYAYSGGPNLRTLVAWCGANGAPAVQLSPGLDNTYNLGGSAYRWAVIFAGSGTINTSDEREKHWRGALEARELRAAKRIIGELGIYQWNDAIAEKGEDGARLHFGVRAQQSFSIMEDEGLDWTRYAWCCYDEWEGGARYGVRPDQLAFWLIAAQAAMQAELEARIAALEAA